MIGIYKITNLINGKSYIGQSINIHKRFIAHKNTAFNPNCKSYDYPLYRAIRKYGLENFLFEIIEECDEEELNEKEIYYVAKYQAHGENGYNLDDGGDSAIHYVKLSNDKVLEIINRLKTSLDSSEVIGEEFGVTGRAIRSINSGECCHQKTETYPIRPALYSIEKSDSCDIVHKQKNKYCQMCGKEIDHSSEYCIECAHILQRRVQNRPEPLELAKMIKEKGFKSVGKIFNVSDNTIKKWCESYKIPRMKNELISWYNLQVGIKEQIKEQKEKINPKKKVHQINIDTGEIIATYESASAAAQTLGKKSNSHITEVCNGKLKQAYGYKWKFI